MEWFRHDVHAHNDIKVRKLIKACGVGMLGVYWISVEYLFEHEGSAQRSDLEDELDFYDCVGGLAHLIEFGLLEEHDGTITSQRVLKELEFQREARRIKSEAGRKGNEVRWGNRKAIAEQSQSDPKAIATQSQNIADDRTLTLTNKENNSVPKGTSLRESASDGSAKRFKKPTVEEVRQYCSERGNDIDAEAFWCFYESKGWKVGSAPMKSWKACIVTWEKDPRRQESKRRKMATGAEWNRLSDDGTFELR